jgi:hypothetical protein
MNELKCPACGSLALVYPNLLESSEPVTCANCGEFVLTYGEPKKRFERAPSSNSGRLSGC